MNNNSVEKKEKSIKYLLVVISIIIILLWASLYYVQNQNIKTVYKTIELNGRLYLELVNDIIQSNLYSQDVIETLFFERAEMLIHLVMEDHSTLISDSLRQKMLIHHICVIDTLGNLMSSLPKGCTQEVSIDQLPKTEEFVLLELEDNPEAVYIVSFRNEKWFVASIKKEDYFSLLKPIQLSTIFSQLSQEISTVSESIETLPQIRYLVIQDSRGIIAATENVHRMQKISSDAFLSSNLESETIASRETSFENKKVLEIVRPFSLEDSESILLRLGVSVDRIESLKRNRTLLFIIYSIIFSGVLILEYLFYRNHIKINRITESLQKAEYMAGIGELGREVAHEIKNPLNAISMILQRIRDEAIPDKEGELQKWLSVSFDEIERLNGIAERFLDYSRPIILKIKKVNVDDFIGTIVEIFDQEYKNKNIHIQIKGNKNLFWYFDIDALTQVLINIIKNSVESFLPEQENMKIQIEFFEKDKEMTIMIVDNGSGISLDKRKKVWDLYFSTKERGNGLGLPISRKIIKAHQGEIYIKRSTQNGTEIIIRLPKSEAE
ncbi:MAG: ATP-binding protein [Candidatus Celaenobacter antarcticus]|nr:ATP-binding protein [Candidatus Celaenobacter antarcticus]